MASHHRKVQERLVALDVSYPQRIGPVFRYRVISL